MDHYFIPHGHCYLWNPGLVWLHILSDSFIALAYYSIPITLYYFVCKRKDLPFNWIFLLFAAFIIACGTTHIAEVWTIWHPTYWASGLLKAGTALVSVLTAVELIPLVPLALALPSPEQLRHVNTSLQNQVSERLQIEAELRGLQDQLEQRVQMRTTELVQVNQQLQQEIAERQSIAKELHRSEVRFQRLVEANIIGIISARLDGVVTEANDAFLELVGYTEAEVEAGAVRWDAMTPPEFRHLDATAIEQLRTQGVMTSFEKEYFHKDGQRIPVIVGAAMVEEERAICYVLDIAQLKQAQATLRDSEERLRLALMASNQGLYDLNILTGEAVVTPEYALMLGYNPEEFYETNARWRERLHPEDVSRVSRNYEDYVAGKLDSYRVEFRQRHKLGGWKWILSVGRIVNFDSQGQPLRMLGTHTDITEHKLLEAERERLLVQEREAREQAESANRVKDEFLAVLSHELRSPLNPILGWSNLLLSRPFDSQQAREALQTICRNAKLQSQLIEDLLDISRILQGKLALTISSVQLSVPIHAAIETVHLAAEAKNIQIYQRLDETVGEVLGDVGRLQQIVWNLLSNAIKFSPVGGRVEVCLKQAEIGQKREAVITVSDTGKGISADFLPYVFESFRQEDSKITRKFGGLGLGLAIVRHLVEQHGGSVRVESAGEGQGATFTVLLPIVKTGQSVNEGDEAGIGESNAATQQLPLAGQRILVVDDEADMRELVAFILRNVGAVVEMASSAAAALSLLTAFQPYLLVSDIGMPTVDGFSLIREIRNRGYSAEQLPAIALTAYAKDEDWREAMNAGFQQHLAKPIEPDALVMAIVNLLS